MGIFDVMKTWALILLVLVTLAVLVYPIYVIRPFRAQGSIELALALTIRSWAPLVSLAAALASVGLAYSIWPRKTALLAAITCMAAIGTRINIYERMFHRIDVPAFDAASAAKVDSDDMVLAVRVNGGARAYPVRTMSYHHLVNDWVGGAPIISTY